MNLRRENGMIFTLKNFYKSKEWENFRKVIIAERTDKEDGLVHCEHCGKPILGKYDLIIHHIEELNDANVNDVFVSLNPKNVACVCFRCHNQLHRRFGFGNGGYKPVPKKVYIVYGAPCSGKSSWVNDVSSEDDLIVDMDSIWECISNSKRYAKPDRLRSVAFEVRDKLYDVIKYRSGSWQNAYVIAGGARRGDRERLAKRIGADEMIFIDTKKAECLRRIGDRGDKWRDYINEWFDEFQAEN